MQRFSFLFSLFWSPLFILVWKKKYIYFCLRSNMKRVMQSWFHHLGIWNETKWKSQQQISVELHHWLFNRNKEALALFSSSTDASSSWLIKISAVCYILFQKHVTVEHLLKHIIMLTAPTAPHLWEKAVWRIWAAGPCRSSATGV